MKGILKRIESNKIQTTGILTIIDEVGKVVFKCKTLELPWLDNHKSKSCIVKDTYSVKQKTSKKYGKHFHITEVEDRTNISITSGDLNTKIKGDVLIGDSFKDDVLNVEDSKKTLDKLLEILPNEWQLHII